MASNASELTVSEHTAGTVCLLTIEGVLDSRSYLKLRDAVIKAALDEPRAVLVDVDALDVPASSAWSVFTSARWHVSTWPDVPIVLVCSHAGRRAAIAHTGVTRYVALHASAEAALNALAGEGLVVRQRARVELPASLASLRRARELVAEYFAAWSQEELISVATVVVNVFVENVLQHTISAPVLILESDESTVTVSVQDCSGTPASRHEDASHGPHRVSGLAIVSALCRAWGSTPTPSGKTVWAVVGPENLL
ncbi:STAS domain-containing protein [Mycobacterium kyorinense]|uniref:Sulfate transporter n=1 Tax=Mycobacterium kyorinense TaxID=487514 RepID=A0A1X1XVU2_9MYCO|nr:STAS domain-containing protein [Mycobacterium kyorinense]ORW02901.1 sulfate transporter [Mycobacterium kyorinense]